VLPKPKSIKDNNELVIIYIKIKREKYKRMNIYNFNDVDWGPDEAKGDKNLVKYFLKIPEYDGILNGYYRYIVGRKGTGKTAIIEKIKDDVGSEAKYFETSMSLRDFPLSLVKKLRDKSFRDKSQFVPVWKFLILVEICKFISIDQSARPIGDVLDLRDFIKLNFPNEFTIVDTLTCLDKKNSKVSLTPKFLGLSCSEEESTQRVEIMHYQNASKLLQNKIKNIDTDSRYFLLFDELDEGFRAGDKNLRLLLLSLLRAIEDIFLELNRDFFEIRPVVALRSDIFDSLEDNDLNKLDDYLVRLTWYSDKDCDYSLKSLVNERIKASIPILSENGWQSLADDNDVDLPSKVKSLWSYIANRTFERPRDIVKFLKYARKETKSGPLKFKNVDKAELQFSNWFYNELRDEVHSHLPIWKESLQAITKVGKGVFDKEKLEKIMIQDVKIKNYIESNNSSIDLILEKLFDFGVIGNLNDCGRWLFKYKDHDLPYDSNMKIIIHFGFSKKLRTYKL